MVYIIYIRLHYVFIQMKQAHRNLSHKQIGHLAQCTKLVSREVSSGLCMTEVG